MTLRYLEDFAVGQTYGSGRIRIEGDRIKSFAAEFDPQPFHLDDDAARNSIFGGLAASGWHTAALTMRLLVESELKPAGGIVGAGFDEFRWPRPVRPEDELHLEIEVLEVRPSKSPAEPRHSTRTMRPCRSLSATSSCFGARYRAEANESGSGLNAATMRVRSRAQRAKVLRKGRSKWSPRWQKSRF